MNLNLRIVLVVALALVTMGALGWWLFGAADIQIGRFFAAEPSASPTPFCEIAPTPGACPDTNNAVCYSLPEGCGWHSDGSPAYALRFGHLDMDPVSGLLFNIGRGDVADHTTWDWFYAPASTDAWCSGSTELSKASPPPQRPSLPGTIRCPDGSSGGIDYANYPTCGITPPACAPPSAVVVAPTATPTQTPAPTPTPVLVPVQCAPDTQHIDPGGTAALEAVGGDGTYHWNVTGGGVVQSGGNDHITISYAIAGTKTVRVSSVGSTAVCVVTVGSITGTGAVTVSKQVLDLQSASSTPGEALNIHEGMVVQFVTTVHSNSAQPLTNLFFRDTLPTGLSYVAGSTSIDGQQLTVDTVATTGLSLGTLQPNDGFTVRWSARADETGLIPAGSHEVHPQAIVTADGVSAVADDVVLVIQGGGMVTGPSGVSTGPGDTTMLALIAAAGVMLLYAAYTRSDTFHRKEVRRVARGQDPLDFRS